MWRDLADEELKYFKKLEFDLKKKIKFHGIIMIISYIFIMVILFFTGSIKLKYLFEILEILAINPFMWIFMYIYLKISDLINCISIKGYTKCKDVRILDIVPEDSSKSSDLLANIKISDTGEVIERVMCHNGEKIRKIILEKGLYEEALLIDLKGHRDYYKDKNKKSKDKEENDSDDEFSEVSEALYSEITNNKEDLNKKKKKEDLSNYMVYDLTNL